MKEIIYNEDNLKESNINRIVKRAKAIIINSNDEILFGYSDSNYQLPGGHLEDNETYDECLVREIKEETGIDIPLEKRESLLTIKYYCKDYPSKGVNTEYIAKYFCIKTDLKPNLKEINLTENEKEGMFELRYIHKDKAIEELKNSLNTCTKEKVVKDTIKVIDKFLELSKIGEKSCGAIVINEGKVLLIKSVHGIYGFPKGYVENNETEKETAIRETKEETNLDIVIDENMRFAISYIVKGVINKDVVYYIAKPKNNIDLKPQEEEVAEVLWVNIEEVDNYLSFDNIKELWKDVLVKLKKF